MIFGREWGLMLMQIFNVNRFVSANPPAGVAEAHLHPPDYQGRRRFSGLALLWARAMMPPRAPASRKVGPLAWQFSAVARGL